MDKVARLPDKQRAELFEETAMRKGIGPAIIEKDFWVCWILSKLFSVDSIAEKIMFKGGTSLSKVFKVVERFSEDIDLVLNWDELTDEDPQEQRTNKQQKKFNEQLKRKSHLYIQEQLLPEIASSLDSICEARISNNSPAIVDICYPAAFAENYLRPEILLEIGPMALWCPNAQYQISSYAAEEFPGIFDNPRCMVQTIKAERTFWEKATILHHEANRPENIVQPPRYSRHYYDLACMAETEIAESALNQLDLLESVSRFKDKFYPRSWARYDLAKPSTFRLIPSQKRIIDLEEDYQQMQIMFFGNIPSFAQIIDNLSNLEHSINR